MDERLLKPYQPSAVEPAVYKRWEASGFFNPDKLPGDRPESFTVIMPPPNANGSLHLGHAVFVTIEDLIIRFQRLRGKKTLWLPGADHAGFETQVVYEKKLEKEGRTRFGIPPDQLRQEIMDFTLANKSLMEDQLRRLGASCDWSREKFTLDPAVVETVYATFQKLTDDGLVYRGKRIVNWCAKHQTSLSELETEFVEKTDPLYYLQYGPFVIATARPETKFGDKYVVMHPADARYTQYAAGQKIELEWINGPVTATVIKDEVIDPAFGTGVMTITPWHDATDFGIAERHNLDKEQIIDERGRLLPIAGEFAGLKITDARAKIVKKLEAKGLVVKVDEKYKHQVKVCYKCGQPIEPQIKEQWFVKMKPLAAPVVAAIERGEITFYPEHYQKIMLHWLGNIEDWNISRQIVWGIPIPGSPDETFDTWFSSGQWPFATLGFPDAPDFTNFYPTQVMETAGEIIFFWVARMLMLGLYRTGQLPFRTIYLHGLIVDRGGEKMSKSRGNVIDPLPLANQYGTDALRMALIIGNTPGTNARLSEEKVRGYQHFANKLWNISRFVLEKTSAEDINATGQDWENFKTLARDVTNDLENYRFHLAGEKLYHYLWHELADKIIERVKKSAAADNAEDRALLRQIWQNSLILLHPFMPFITEELWSLVPEHKSLLLVESWPHF